MRQGRTDLGNQYDLAVFDVRFVRVRLGRVRGEVLIRQLLRDLEDAVERVAIQMGIALARAERGGV